jgi:septum formation protein
MAREKALAVAAAPDELVLAADTTVALGRRIHGKPADAAEAAAVLRALSGRRHRVVTAVALRLGDRLWERDVESVVRMKRLSEAEVAGYVATGDWQGKAGGYSIQGPAGALIPWIQGSYSAIVGLPLAETAALLQAAGWPVWR